MVSHMGGPKVTRLDTAKKRAVRDRATFGAMRQYQTPNANALSMPGVATRSSDCVRRVMAGRNEQETGCRIY